MSALLRKLETPQQRAAADKADQRTTDGAMPATGDGDGPDGCLVATPATIYVLVPKRADFDRIGAAPRCHGQRMVLNVETLRTDLPRLLLTKVVESGGVTVVFQHWGKPV